MHTLNVLLTSPNLLITLMALTYVHKFIDIEGVGVNSSRVRAALRDLLLMKRGKQSDREGTSETKL